jgi:hypothetical protein
VSERIDIVEKEFEGRAFDHSGLFFRDPTREKLDILIKQRVIARAVGVACERVLSNNRVNFSRAD